MSISTGSGTLVDRRVTSPIRSAAPRVLVIEPDKDHARALTRVVRALSPEARVVSTPSEAPEELAFDVVVAPWDGFDPAERDAFLDRASSLMARRRIVLHSAAWDRNEMSALLASRGACHLMARTGDVDAGDLLVTLQKIVRGDAFGIEKYFAWGAPTTTMMVRRTHEASGVLEVARNVVGQIGVQTRFADVFVSAVDELLTNALYNAPVDAQGRHRFATLHRAQEVLLDAGEDVVVTFCGDGQRVGVSVVDPFGSLRPETAVAYLAKCLKKGEDQVDQKDGGAGLGLYCVYEAASQLAISVEPGRRTEMISLLDMRGRFKDFAARPKSFHLFVDG